MDDAPHEAPTDASHDPTQDVSIEDSGGALEDAARAVAWVGLGVSTLTAIVATYLFYAHASSAIATMVPPEQTDLFLAGFNLAVLLVAVAAVLVLVRRLASDELL